MSLMADDKPYCVFVFPNGMVAVTDKSGQQVPEWQGHKSEIDMEALRKLAREWNE